jgi:hypothetical protein
MKVQDQHQIKPETQSCQMAVKSSFFGQYLEQIIAKETKYPNSPTINTTTVLLINGLSNYHLELKPLSKITDEDADKLQYTLVNVVGLDGLIRQNSIELVKEVISNYEQIDCLFMLPSSFSDKARELGYAIDWNNYKVSKQIELGWVQLL